MANRIIVVDTKNDRRWDKYVNDHPLGTVYHSAAWGSVLETTFGYTPYYLAIEKESNGEFEGIIPLFHIQNRLIRNKLVSLPFTAYCRRLIPKNEFENILSFIKKNISEKAGIEFKFHDANECNSEIFEKCSNYVVHVLHIGTDLEKTFRTFHDTSVRQKVRRAAKSGLTFRIGEAEKDLKDFYRLFVGIRKKHGLPPHPYKFFLNMWAVLRPNNLMILPLVEFGKRVIAAGIILKSKDTYHFEYSASDQDNIKMFPNHKLIWDSIGMAHQEGIQYFDFGRSSITNRSLIEFKERWGAKRYDLPYFYYPRGQKHRMEESSKADIVRRINTLLPDFLLQVEGNIFYRLIK